MPQGYCETDDVRKALQKAELSGSTGTGMIQPAIEGVSNWFGRQTNGHWYDSNDGTGQDLVATATETAEDVLLDVPSSPYRQRGQLLSDYHDAQYPVTKAGRYAKIRLPHLYVDSISTLNVRQRDGSVVDWVAASDKQSGRGEDYYVTQPGQASYGQSYLFIRAASIGAREDFANLLEATYTYGLDEQTEPWSDVRRGIANLAAAQAVDDDNVLAQIPDQGQLVGVDTQVQNLVDAAMRHLEPYLGAPVA